MSFTLSEKSPLSPYSMFAVVFGGEGKHGTTDLAMPAQCRLIGTVAIGDDLIGMIGADLGTGYNPFDLYGAARPGRNEPLPPHLVFAELEENARSACAFLNAYGPLRGRMASVAGPLKPAHLKKWKHLSENSPTPEEFFRETLGVPPLLPPPPTPTRDFHESSLANFWFEQSEFELTVRLVTALNSHPGEQYRNIRRALNRVGVDWGGRHTERWYVTRAIEQVRETMNSELSLTPPRVVPTLDFNAIEGVWGCYSLHQAMYLMLFLDIASRGMRIAQCEKCETLFYTQRERGRYCSALCENRARALRAYHNKKGRS